MQRNYRLIHIQKEAGRSLVPLEERLPADGAGHRRHYQPRHKEGRRQLPVRFKALFSDFPLYCSWPRKGEVLKTYLRCEPKSQQRKNFVYI